jgi:hypothetical protein
VTGHKLEMSGTSVACAGHFSDQPGLIDAGAISCVVASSNNFSLIQVLASESVTPAESPCTGLEKW